MLLETNVFFFNSGLIAKIFRKLIFFFIEIFNYVGKSIVLLTFENVFFTVLCISALCRAWHTNTDYMTGIYVKIEDVTLCLAYVLSTVQCGDA